jgi:hypothetical protein
VNLLFIKKEKAAEWGFTAGYKEAVNGSTIHGLMLKSI